ncbi:MAG: metallophosphoesterase [Myxococcales bacterium]|nr:metallophosphoesterase [Myxococcales bacterium]
MDAAVNRPFSLLLGVALWLGVLACDSRSAGSPTTASAGSGAASASDMDAGRGVAATGAGPAADGPSGTTDVAVAASADAGADAGGAAPRRVVVVGDLHADIDVTREVFQLAGATDADGTWIGGALTVVQLGDMIGRSDDDRLVLDFIFDVRERAAAAGGAVRPLIGNHEVMAGRVDNQAVGLAPFAAFEGIDGLDLDDPRLQILAPEQRARGAALMAGGPYAKRLAAFPTVLKLGATVFVHGGVVPRWAEYGIDRVNEEVRQWLQGDTLEPDSSLGVDDGDRVMWTRQFSSLVDAGDCAVLEQSLAILGARRMVVAHTVHGEITSYCDEKVWVIDVGMSRAYGGDIQLLEIVDDAEVSVITP